MHKVRSSVKVCGLLDPAIHSPSTPAHDRNTASRTVIGVVVQGDHHEVGIVLRVPVVM